MAIDRFRDQRKTCTVKRPDAGVTIIEDEHPSELCNGLLRDTSSLIINQIESERIRRPTLEFPDLMILEKDDLVTKPDGGIDLITVLWSQLHDITSTELLRSS